MCIFDSSTSVISVSRCAVRLPSANCQSIISVADGFDPVVYGGKPWALQASSQDNTVTNFHGYAHASGRYFCLLTGLVSVPGVCK